MIVCCFRPEVLVVLSEMSTTGKRYQLPLGKKAKGSFPTAMPAESVISKVKVHTCSSLGCTYFLYSNCRLQQLMTCIQENPVFMHLSQSYPYCRHLLLSISAVIRQVSGSIPAYQVRFVGCKQDHTPTGFIGITLQSSLRKKHSLR